MDFRLTGDHERVRQMIRDFTEREIAPLVSGDDELAYYNRSLLEKLGELGILGLCIPQRYGGGGYDYISLAIACEEFERVDTACRVTLSVHLALNSMTILQWGTEDQKMNYLIPQTKGLRIGAFALSEPESGSDIKSIKTTARPEGRGYVLNGLKKWVSLADVADSFLVFACTDPEKRNGGITCFLVEREYAGVEAASTYGKMNMRLSNAGKLELNNVYVPLENVIGEVGEGLKVALSAIDNARYTAAAGAIGMTKACLEAGIKHAREREAFGQQIGKYQLVQEMIARMALGLETSRLLVYKVGWMKNQGLPCTRYIAMAKWHACQAAFQTAADTMQILGGSGYVASSPYERYLRNAKSAEIYTGTREILELLLAEHTLGYRQEKPLRKNLPTWPFE